MNIEKEKIVIENNLKVSETTIKECKDNLERYESADKTSDKIVICLGLAIGVAVATYFFVLEGKFNFLVVFLFLFSTLVGFIISDRTIRNAFYNFKTKDIEYPYILRKKLEEYDLLNREVNDIEALKEILSSKDTVVLLYDDYHTIEILGLDENGLERKIVININNVYYKDTDNFTMIYKMEDDDFAYRDVRCFYVDLELPREYFTKLKEDGVVEKKLLLMQT